MAVVIASSSKSTSLRERSPTPPIRPDVPTADAASITEAVAESSESCASERMSGKLTQDGFDLESPMAALRSTAWARAGPAFSRASKRYSEEALVRSPLSSAIACELERVAPCATWCRRNQEEVFAARR